MRSPKISIIIPHYEAFESLLVCLQAIDKQTVSRDSYEVIVADNNSKNVREYRGTILHQADHLISVIEKGAGPARNGGVESASGDILAFIDSDCIPHECWLEEGVKALRDYDIVGSRILVSASCEHDLSGAEAFERCFAFDNERYIRDEKFSVTAGLFCKRETFNAVGGFNIHVSEDRDWCNRAVALGFSIGFAPDSIISHPARSDWPALLRKWERLSLETFYFMLSQPKGRLRWFLRSFLIPVSVLPHSIRVLLTSSLSSGRQRRRALVTLVRLRFWRFANALYLTFFGRLPS